MSTQNCEECHIGRYRAATVPFMHPLGQYMLTIPNAPAQVCDVCRHVRYDAQFLNRISYLLARTVQQPLLSAEALAEAARNEALAWQSMRR